MPKQKTKKIIVKRFKITKSGKVQRRRSHNRHLRTKKSAKRKARLNKVVTTKNTHAKKIRKIMGK